MCIEVHLKLHLSALNMYWMRIESAWDVHCLCIEIWFYVHRICIECALVLHLPCLESALNVFWMGIESAYKLHWVCIELSLTWHWICTEFACGCAHLNCCSPRRKRMLAREAVFGTNTTKGRLTKEQKRAVQDRCTRGVITVSTTFWKPSSKVLPFAPPKRKVSTNALSSPATTWA